MSQEVESTPEAHAARYDMSTERIQQLTGQLLQSNADRLPNREEYRFVAIEVPGSSPSANIGRYVERVVFEETFGNDTEKLSQEYGPYEQASTFFISVDQKTRQPTGVLRTISHSDQGLKSWDDAVRDFSFKEENVYKRKGLDDLEKVWDVGTIAVLPDFRAKTGPVSILLERAMYLSAEQHDIQALVSIIDDGPLTKLRSKWRGIGMPFKTLPGTKPGPYLDSKKSYAVSGYIPEFKDVVSRHRESFRGRLIAKYALGDALDRLILGTSDAAILLRDDYKNQDA